MKCLIIHANIFFISACFSANDDSSEFYAITMAHHETIKELEKFAGCEIIIGNLILMNISDPDGTKLEFFSSVKKITGYLAVIQSEMPYLPFPNLQIISGQNLIPKQKKPKYALFVSHVRNTAHTGLNSLREVSNGHVLLENNSHNLTGYSDNIMWDDILLNNATATVTPLADSTDFDLNDCKIVSVTLTSNKVSTSFLVDKFSDQISHFLKLK